VLFPLYPILLTEVVNCFIALLLAVAGEEKDKGSLKQKLSFY